MLWDDVHDPIYDFSILLAVSRSFHVVFCAAKALISCSVDSTFCDWPICDYYFEFTVRSSPASSSPSVISCHGFSAIFSSKLRRPPKPLELQAFFFSSTLTIKWEITFTNIGEKSFLLGGARRTVNKDSGGNFERETRERERETGKMKENSFCWKSCINMKSTQKI